MDFSPFQLSETAKQWANALISCLEGIPHLFLAITVEFLPQARAMELVEELSNVIDKVPLTRLKIILIGGNSTNFKPNSNSLAQNNLMTVRIGSPIPWTPQERCRTNQLSRFQRGRLGRGPRTLSNGPSLAFAQNIII